MSARACYPGVEAWTPEVIEVTEMAPRSFFLVHIVENLHFFLSPSLNHSSNNSH